MFLRHMNLLKLPNTTIANGMSVPIQGNGKVNLSPKLSIKQANDTGKMIGVAEEQDRFYVLQREGDDPRDRQLKIACSSQGGEREREREMESTNSSQGSSTSMEKASSSHGSGIGPSTQMKKTPKEHVILMIKSQEGLELYYKVPTQTKMRKLLTAYCLKRDLDYMTVQFFIDGEHFDHSRTPAELGLVDGDEIDAMIQMLGA